MKKIVVTVLGILLLPGAGFGANPVLPEKLHPEWLACQADADCTAVEIGCTYWQPVSVKSKEAMAARYRETCVKNLPPGPEPDVSCVENVCRAPAIAHRKAT